MSRVNARNKRVPLVQAAAVGLAGLLLLVLLVSPVLLPALRAQTGGGYELTWWTADGGGATFSTGDGYQVGGTIGQPDAGTLSGGGFTLTGGFWGAAELAHRSYLPLVFK